MSSTRIRAGQTISGVSRKRRYVLALGIGTLAVPFGAFAQQPRKIWRIGFLAIGARPASLQSHALGSFARGMRELGYIEGQDYVIEWRFSEGKPEAFASAAAELAQMKVDIMIAATGNGINAARKAGGGIPIVMVNMGDPVSAGFVASLARPGGNITGLSNQSGDTVRKHPELLRIAMPGLMAVAVLFNPAAPIGLLYVKQIQASTAALGLKLRQFEVRTGADIDDIFDTLKRERIGALIATPDAVLSVQARRIAELAAGHRIATMFWTREHVEAGGLMSYGQNNAEHYHRAAYYVDRILKGAKPADLPVEQGRSIELVVNLKTANALGLKIPQELILRADKVIE